MNFILYVIVNYIIIYVLVNVYDDAISIYTNFFNFTAEDNFSFLLCKSLGRYISHTPGESAKKNCINEKDIFLISVFIAIVITCIH